MDQSEFSNNLRQFQAQVLRFENETIEVGSLILDRHSFSNSIRTLEFFNCHFVGHEILFEGIVRQYLQIVFRECKFSCNIHFTDGCEINELKFIDTKEIGHILNISSNSISQLYLLNTEEINRPELNGNIRIQHNKITDKVNLKYLYHTSGQFDFTDNTLECKIADRADLINISFRKARLNNADFSSTNFGEEATFDDMILNYDSSTNNLNFIDCIFGKAYFNRTNFGSYAIFSGSNFNEVGLFISCQNIHNTLAEFSGVTFHKRIFFDNSKFDRFVLKRSLFSGISSFNSLTVNTIKLNETVFKSPAFFDEIQIKRVNEVNRKTFRSIKQELQKTDNRIDFHRFRSYELDAFRRELKEQKRNRSDQFILWMNGISTKHGRNWLKGLSFTLAVGLLFYIIYFASEMHHLEFSMESKSINSFISGYFKFLIPSYTSPFGDAGLSKWYQHLLFISGKVFIGYGIYQTIQAFRKFRI